MGIRFQCPNGHRLHVKAELAGQIGVCPHCQARVAIPRAEEPPAAATTEDAGAANVKADSAPAKPVVQPATESTPKPAAPTELPKAKPVRAVAKAVVRTEPPTELPAQAPSPPAPAAPPPPPTPETPPPVEWRMQTETGEQLGPGDTAMLSSWQAAGQLTDDSHVWRPGWPEWRRVGDVRGELPLAAATPTPTPNAPAEKASAASRYVTRRKQAAQRQVYVALILLGLVITVAIVMAIVLSTTGANSPPPASAPPAAVDPEPAPGEEAAPAEAPPEEPIAEPDDLPDAMEG